MGLPKKNVTKAGQKVNIKEHTVFDDKKNLKTANHFKKDQFNPDPFVVLVILIWGSFIMSHFL